MANQTEIIYITGESNKVITNSPARIAKFGLCPKLQVWIAGDGGQYYLSDVQPTLDAPAPNIGAILFDFGSNITGFIVLK